MLQTKFKKFIFELLMKFRKPASKLSIRKRCFAFNANEYLQSKMLYCIIVYLFNYLRFNNLSERKTKSLREKLYICTAAFISFNVEPNRPILSRPSYERTIGSFSESECWNFFETRKCDLTRLYMCLRFNKRFTFPNRANMNGEEVMLRGLYELVSGSDQYEICSIFGLEQPQQSFAFTCFVNHIYDTFQDLVTNNLQWWYDNGFLLNSMEAIRLKFGGNNLFTTCAFIDCNCLQTSTVGGGPAEEGARAARWDPRIQQAFYNGWKSIHGLKHQTMDCAYGMTVDLFGPSSLRRNDLYLLRQSQLNTRLRDLQMGSETQLTIYGDSIYPRLSHLHSSWRQGRITAIRRAENVAYSKVRISIEWNYGATAGLFSYLTNYHKLRLMSGGNVARIYTVATILRNCHVAMYGSETSYYFNLEIPMNMLEMYTR
jgi:hypothetical protein